MVQLSHPYMTTGKTITLTIWAFVSKVTSLLFKNVKICQGFCSKEQHLLISWLQSPLTVIAEPPKRKSATVSIFPPSILWSNGIGCLDLRFLNVNFKPTFSISSFTFIKRLFSSSSLSAVRVVSSAYLRLLIFLSATLTPTCDWASPAFHMMYSVYKLNKQGDNQFSSVPQLCLTLCNPMDCSIPGFPVHHQLPEFTQIHAHWVGDAVQPLLSPSPPAFNLSRHQGLFK